MLPTSFPHLQTNPDDVSRQHFEERIRALTQEINGQWPRPWMTDSVAPHLAQVFIVGLNPATAYPVNEVAYERHIDALFNRNGESCRGLYAEVRRKSPSRGNIELLAEKLVAVGVSNVLETNVVCYGTPKSKDLRRPEHAGGEARGTEIFRTLVQEIRPKVMIVHGVKVGEKVSATLDLHPCLPEPPSMPTEFVQYDARDTTIFVIPSLALPAFRNKPEKPLRAFCHWADEYLDKVAEQVRQVLDTATNR